MLICMYVKFVFFCSTSISVDEQLMSLVSIQYDKELMMLAIPAYWYVDKDTKQ